MKRLVLWSAIAGVAAAAAVFAPQSQPPAPEGVVAAVPERSAGTPPDSGRFAKLPEREPIGRRGGEIFASRSWTPPAPPPPAAPAVAAPPPPPTAPPVPYRVAGQVVHGKEAQVVLAKGDAVLAVSVGDTLEGGYRVEAIGAERVTLVYVPLGTRQDLAINSALHLEASSAGAVASASVSPPASATASVEESAERSPARLRWEGPREVRAGGTFNVALKVTSAQPVRASPLQLSYDAKLLEPVDVRAGGFFAGGMFSYRVNPGGSIFVGAAGKGAAAADAELLVVTFKPIRAGATAELKISSLVLQNASGRAITHEQPASFRTSIVQ